MKKDKNVLQLVAAFFRDEVEALMVKILGWYYKTKINEEEGCHIYWMNIVRCLGGSEKMKPCEFFFDNPTDAILHKMKVDECGTWEYVTTVTIHSREPLTVTNYRRMLEEDFEYMHLLDEMNNYPEVK